MLSRLRLPSATPTRCIPTHPTSLRAFASSPTCRIEAIREQQNVTRIERLMGLGNKLAQMTGTSFAPTRIKGVGAYKKALPGKREDLGELPTTRKMSESYVQMDLKFSESEELREQYVGGQALVRMGRLMEDFDALAGAAAYRHVLPNGAKPTDASSYGLYIVTAAVDRMDMLTPLADKDGNVPDLRLSGHVSYASESSLEVFMRMSTIPSSPDDQPITILLGRFAMACRSTAGGKQKIAQLVLESDAERELWEMGKEMRAGKKARTKASLELTPPTAEEAKMMHDLFVGRAEIYSYSLTNGPPERNAPTPPDVVWMSDTEIKSGLMMHPSERNVHQKIFGGYLMRLCYETAYSTACLFARTPVTFLALDELRFALPVEIGSLLMLDSKVTFAPIQGEHRSFHVSVEAGTTNLRTGDKQITNTFHFTFESDQPLKRYVLPRSYRQAMQWLDAQRRREHGITVRRIYQT